MIKLTTKRRKSVFWILPALSMVLLSQTFPDEGVTPSDHRDGSQGYTPTQANDAPEPAYAIAKEEKGWAEEVEQRIGFSGELRFRYEYWDPIAYSGSLVDNNDDFALMRTRLGLDFDFHERVAAFIQLQDSRLFGEEGNAVPANQPVASVGVKSEDTFDLHQGYMDVRRIFRSLLGEHDLTLRLGRQELSYGDQRLVSPLDWSNVGRAWDAARFLLTPSGALEGLQVDLFASIIRDSDANAAGNPTGDRDFDDKQEFHGIYSSYKFQPVPGLKWRFPGEREATRTVFSPHHLDIYGFFRNLGGRAFTNEDGEPGNVREFTVGGRLKGGALGWDWSGEGVYQGGRWAGDTINAFGFIVGVGYNIPPSLLQDARLRLGVEFDYGSGDSDPDDDRRETLDPLFPFGHALQGFQDLFTWKNGQDLIFKVTTELPRCPALDLNPIWFEIQYHVFWLTEREDGWFNAGLAEIRRDSTGSSGQLVGTEIDVHMKYTIVDFGSSASSKQRLWLWLGYSHFFAEDFVENTGSSPDRDWAFAQLALDF